MTYADITNYIELLGMSHKKIQAVVNSDVEEITDLSGRGDTKYPCLWIQTPEDTIDGDEDSFVDNWQVIAVVMHSSDPKDVQRTKYNLEITYNIARSLLFKIMSHVANGTIDFSISSKTLTSVGSLYADDLYGWRITLDISAKGLPCSAYDGDFDDEYEADKKMYFIVEKSGNDITLIEEGDTFETEWSITDQYSYDNGALAPLTDYSILTGRTNVLILRTASKTISGKTYQRKSSVFIDAPGVYRSVPYHYTKY